MIQGKWFAPGNDLSAEVLPVREAEFRGQRIGDLVLRLLLFKAQSHAAREVRLSCPRETEGFFARLGFQAVSSDNETVEMTLDGKEISLDSCASCKKQNCPNRK